MERSVNTAMGQEPSKASGEEVSSDSATDPFASLEQACQSACQSIAPAWPLDRAIAVNPHWGRIHLPVRQVAARMAVLGSIRVFPSRRYIKQAWELGRISPTDLNDALKQLNRVETDRVHCIEALQQPLQIQPLPLLIDILDDDPLRHTRLSWREAITHQVSQTCAAYFDNRQADWQPSRNRGLYAFWRETLTQDNGIGLLMGLPDLQKGLKRLPLTRQDAERWALERLALPQAVWADYLESVLLTVNGWASWCAYLGWQAKLRGEPDTHLRELLAIRLAWGAVLLECKSGESTLRAFQTLSATWRHAQERLNAAEHALWIDEVWQFALETGYQRELALRLESVPEPQVVEKLQPTVEAQAYFCIDVRSERLRRSLEAIWPAIRTYGFAGFFGLPITYSPLGANLHRPQLPGLLVPTNEVSDLIESADENAASNWQSKEEALKARLRRAVWSEQWQANSRWPGAAFSFVEAIGLGYLSKLAGLFQPPDASRIRDDLAHLPEGYRSRCRPALVGLDLDAKTNLAARILHLMGLEQDLAPLVLLVGHGSQSANNAHAAALDCGACCGQTGEVNVRTLARLLNDPAVRQALTDRNVSIPSQTRFLAALHNTTTDEIEWFDEDLLPEESRERCKKIKAVFDQACDQVRRERAVTLGLNPRAEHGRLRSDFRRRASDCALTRPEWGLCGNASFIVAPRHRTQGVMLNGRTFLHDYAENNDPDGSTLELLLTAPMLVTHWINWQYHASTCEPERLGSGNKVLHNVVGGHLGVFEGNGGDLRIGLPWQSLHDGTQWIHEPLRLTVIVDASTHAIERIVQRHPVVRNLLHNGWLHLWRFDASGLHRYAGSDWQAVKSAFTAAF